MNHIDNSKELNTIEHFFQFGPLIGQYRLSDEFVEELNSKGKEAHIDYKSKLAGHINDEKLFSKKEDYEWFLTKTNNIFLNYISEMLKRYIPEKDIKSVTLQSLWINNMKNGEYNPPHNHSGAISFVIYTQVPEEILQENERFKGTSSGPGCINFLYGEASDLYASNFSFVPSKGMMFVFPASLRHFVAPFKSPVTRTSISGNLIFTN